MVLLSFIPRSSYSVIWFPPRPSRNHHSALQDFRSFPMGSAVFPLLSAHLNCQLGEFPDFCLRSSSVFRPSRHSPLKRSTHPLAARKRNPGNRTVLLSICSTHQPARWWSAGRKLSTTNRYRTLSITIYDTPDASLGTQERIWAPIKYIMAPEPHCSSQSQTPELGDYSTFLEVSLLTNVYKL